MRSLLAALVVAGFATSCDRGGGSPAGGATERSPRSSSAPTPSASPPPAPAPSSVAGQRCLPVVAAECGCVYACGAGSPRAGGGFDVSHPAWPGAVLRARVATWCVEGQCTEAFHAEIVCSGICSPRPADPTCHIDAAGRCVGGSP